MHAKRYSTHLRSSALASCVLLSSITGLTAVAATLTDISPTTSFKLGSDYPSDSPSLGDFEFRANGLLVATGDTWWGGSTIVNSDIRRKGGMLYWNPNFAIFRASYVPEQIEGPSVAARNLNESDFGPQSAGFGNSVARGFGSLASGYGWAYNDFTAAFGQGRSTGIYSMAAGQATDAIGGASFAMGQSTKAMGWGSTALGTNTTANGNHSTATGLQTTAGSIGSFAIGQWNIGEATSGDSPWVWRSSDTVLEVGIGSGVPGSTNPPERANALTVYKDGRVIIHKRQGDISMGVFQ